MNPTRTEAIKRFLQYNTHLDLAELYNYNMEVQVNVAQDGGRRVEDDYKGRQWHGWTDELETWKTFRIPYNAATDPEYEDKPMSFNLDHAEGIGMTGWDWINRQSLWFGFDFDKITEHSKGLTDAQLAEVEVAAEAIPWTTIRRSTSGNGRHIYVFCTPINTNTHTEHAALARSILGMMSALTGFDFHAKVDCNGGNMWVYHRKMKGTNGLTLIKKGTVLEDIPINWRDHIPVISGKRHKSLPQFIEETNNKDSERLFEELTGQRPKIQLDEDHRKLINWLKEHNALWYWDNDHWLLCTHTIYLKEAHEELGFKGIFKTIATGKDRGNDLNAYAFPLRNGAWIVRRFTPGVTEDATWDQDSAGWTRTYFNRNPDLQTAARSNEGNEHPSGGFAFRHAEQAQKSIQMLGGELNLPTWAAGKKAKIKERKDGKLIVQMDYDTSDNAIPGWIQEGKAWKKVVSISGVMPNEPDMTNLDELVRHLVSQTGDNAGWVWKSDDCDWYEEPFLHVKTALKGKGWDPKETDIILGTAISRPWILVNKPFKEEYTGDREWNKNAAQFRFYPTQEREHLHYPHWLRILNHIGKGLDSAIANHEWSKNNGILTGGDYLKCWIASLFQFPEEPLPYLFLYSAEQGTGKTILHEALKLLVTHGVERADVALKEQRGFNEELRSAILCVVEETDLRRDKEAYNKIKDWVTSRTILIHPKGGKVYSTLNTTHWLHCSNDFSACPVFKGDTRITMIEVPLLLEGEYIPRKQLETSLIKEAPDFLASILSLEIPPSPDRLNVPIIITEQKSQLENANQSLLEIFISENCHEVSGKMISFTDFCDKFWETIGNGASSEWSKIKISKELPLKYPAARIPSTGYKHIGNLSFEAYQEGDVILPKLIIKDGKLIPEK